MTWKREGEGNAEDIKPSRKADECMCSGIGKALADPGWGVFGGLGDACAIFAALTELKALESGVMEPALLFDSEVDARGDRRGVNAGAGASIMGASLPRAIPSVSYYQQRLTDEENEHICWRPAKEFTSDCGNV